MAALSLKLLVTLVKQQPGLAGALAAKVRNRVDGKQACLNMTRLRGYLLEVILHTALFCP